MRSNYHNDIASLPSGSRLNGITGTNKKRQHRPKIQKRLPLLKPTGMNLSSTTGQQKTAADKPSCLSSCLGLQVHPLTLDTATKPLGSMRPLRYESVTRLSAEK